MLYDHSIGGEFSCVWGEFPSMVADHTYIRIYGLRLEMIHLLDI